MKNTLNIKTNIKNNNKTLICLIASLAVISLLALSFNSVFSQNGMNGIFTPSQINDWAEYETTEHICAECGEPHLADHTCDTCELEHIVDMPAEIVLVYKDGRTETANVYPYLIYRHYLTLVFYNPTEKAIIFSFKGTTSGYENKVYGNDIVVPAKGVYVYSPSMFELSSAKNGWGSIAVTNIAYA